MNFQLSIAAGSRACARAMCVHVVSVCIYACINTQRYVGVCVCYLPASFNAVEIGAIERAGENPDLGEAELTHLLDRWVPHVNCRFCPVYLSRSRRVCYRVLHSQIRSIHHINQ